MAKKTTKTATQPLVSKFSKEQILKSNCYKNRQDLLNVLLQEGEVYTHDEIKKLIEDFMKGEVE